MNYLCAVFPSHRIHTKELIGKICCIQKVNKKHCAYEILFIFTNLNILRHKRRWEGVGLQN